MVIARILRTYSIFFILIALGYGAPAYADLLFDAPASLNTNSGSDSGEDRFPRIANDGHGHWVAVWESNENLGSAIGTDYDVFVSRSSDNGKSWTSPALLNTNAATDSGQDHTPDIATDAAGNWIVVWNSTENLGGLIGTDNDLFVSKSTNNGATWSAPAVLNSNAGSDAGDDTTPYIATDDAGQWVVVWSSNENLGGTIGTDGDVFTSRSSNNGTSWTAPAIVNSDAATDSVDHYPTGIASDKAGHWVVGFVSNQSGIFLAAYVTASSNNGATWSPFVALNPLDTPYHDADVRIAADGQGNWVAAWVSTTSFTGAQDGVSSIAVSRSSNDGATWSAPKAVNSDAVNNGSSNDFADIQTDGKGVWIATWSSSEIVGNTYGSDLDVFYSISSDNGKTWSPRASVNSNATTDAGADSSPRLINDGKNHWVVVWQSDDTLGGTVGSDADIFVAPATLQDSLRVVSPNGGEKWRKGRNQTISWSSVGSPGANVKLELLQNGNVVRTIAATTPNDGSQRWPVPANVGTGKGYRVRVTSTSRTTIKDTSDAGFRIKAAK